MYRISREFTFSAAHRIEGHPKCGRLHGHNYKVTIFITGHVLDAQGMVLDFGKLDEVMKPVIDEMDHKYLVSKSNVQAKDPYAKDAQARGDAYMLTTPHSTAEELAQLIHFWTWTGLTIASNNVFVSVQETPKNVAYFGIESMSEL